MAQEQVEQVDRDASANLYAIGLIQTGTAYSSAKFAAEIIAGRHDDCTSVQAFARHRLATPDVRNGLDGVTIERIIREQMQEWWDEICNDTGCHPLDLTHGRGTVLNYDARHWTAAVAKFSAERILTAIRALDVAGEEKAFEPSQFDNVRTAILKIHRLRNDKNEWKGFIRALWTVINNVPAMLARIDAMDAFERDIAAEVSPPAAGEEWREIASAPKDGTLLDLWFGGDELFDDIEGDRETDAYWGKPRHSCGEAGQYCDSCPSHDGWVSGAFNHYLTGDEGLYEGEPTHWRPLPAPPALAKMPGAGS